MAEDLHKFVVFKTSSRIIKSKERDGGSRMKIVFGVDYSKGKLL